LFDRLALRYRRLGLHAKGGLGEVSVALDEELCREVALKEIQARFADHPDNCLLTGRSPYCGRERAGPGAACQGDTGATAEG
jgi:hypothetical protein